MRLKKSSEECVRIRLVINGILPCATMTNLNPDAYAANVDLDTEVDWQPSEKSKKSGGKDQLPSLKESIQLGCVSQEYPPRKSILREVGQLGSKDTVKFSKGHAPH